MDDAVKKILIVEDDPANMDAVVMLLQLEDFVPLQAGNARDAVEAASAERPDLILMDITIPDAEGQEAHVAGGFDATRKIKTNPVTAHIPVIALTARTFPHELKAMFEAGCDAYVEKPFEFDTLVGAIREWLP